MKKYTIHIYSPDLLRKLDLPAFDADDTVSLSNGSTYLSFKNEQGKEVELITNNTIVIEKDEIPASIE